jgi:hypothetical protein
MQAQIAQLLRFEDCHGERTEKGRGNERRQCLGNHIASQELDNSRYEVEQNVISKSE